MNKIKTILICLIIIFVTGALCTGLFLMNEQTTTVKLSETCSIDITGEYDTVFENGMNQIKIFDKFNNKEYKSMIVYCNSANAGLQEIMTFGLFKSAFVGNTYNTGAEPVKTQLNGNTVYAIYTSNNITHDNILIISKNRDDCIKIYKSIKYNTNGTTNANKTINNTVDQVNKNTSNGNNSEELKKAREDAFNSGRSYQSYLDSRNNKPTPDPTPTPSPSPSPVNSTR